MKLANHPPDFLDPGAPGLPDDPALPALAAIRAMGLARAIPALGLRDALAAQGVVSCYVPGRRATLTVLAGARHFAVRAYANDPTREARAHEAVGAALGSGAAVRVPPLLAWDRELRVLVVGWLEGPATNELLRRGQGKRAGELAACWVRHAATLPAELGPSRGAAQMLRRAERWIAELAHADADLGAGAAAVADRLARTQPREDVTHLVHGALYARHVLDLGEGPGIVNWRRVGQGPLELDAGAFLATIWRTGRMHESLAAEAARAEDAFCVGTAGLLDERALAWHRSLMLLRLACKQAPRHRNRAVRKRHRAPLGEAARLAAAVG